MSWFRRVWEAPATLALILVNLAVFAVMVVSSRHIAAFGGLTLVEAGSSVYAPGVEVSHWRWLTAAFIHVNLLHIFMNLWVLGQIGALSERAVGRGLLVATYLVTGVVGNALSYMLAASRHIVLNSAGASGGIMGLIGMAATYAWFSGQRQAARALAINILFVLGVGLSLSAGGVRLVDNGAHVGGLVTGILIGFLRVRASRPLPRWLDLTLLGGSFVITAVAFTIVRFTPLPLD
jgi:rhomboid protease GluP